MSANTNPSTQTAPSLLAALTALVNQIEADGLCLKMHGYRAARAAIAKATQA